MGEAFAEDAVEPALHDGGEAVVPHGKLEDDVIGPGDFFIFRGDVGRRRPALESGALFGRNDET